MKADGSFAEFVREQLAGRAGVEFRRRFGGQGIDRNEVFFGLLYQGRLHFKTDAHTRPDDPAAGSEPFQPNVKQRLPAQGFENPDEMRGWAEQASTLAPTQSARRPPPRPVKPSPQTGV